MELHDRISRRRRRGGESGGILLDPIALAPITHPDEPIGRGPILERILDILDPVFDDNVPRAAAISGPPGVGKTAILTTLFGELDAVLGRRDQIIGTTTRARSPLDVRFAVVDGRTADSEYQLYRHLLDALTDETVPEGGVSTAALHDRVMDRCRRHDAVVVACDHLGEPGTLEATIVHDLAMEGNVVPWYVSRDPLGEIDTPPARLPDATVEFEAYREHTLVEIVTDRASRGLAPNALDHDTARSIAKHADGNAHNALALLYDAASRAETDDADRVRREHIDAARDAFPENAVSVARALAQSRNHQRVLASLVSLAPSAPTIPEAATAIAGMTDLTESTVTRFLYELADLELLAREPTDAGTSTVTPRFPGALFDALHNPD